MNAAGSLDGSLATFRYEDGSHLGRYSLRSLCPRLICYGPFSPKMHDFNSEQKEYRNGYRKN